MRAWRMIWKRNTIEFFSTFLIAVSVLTSLGQTWVIELADSDGGGHTSLALDGSGYPHISYFAFSDPPSIDDLKYARRDSTDWHIQTVDETGDVGHYNSLALNDSGLPHISYWDHTNSDLKYAYVPASFVLIGELIGGQVQLTWAAVTEASVYWVYGASNLQWLVPGMGPGYDFRIAVLPASTTTWSSPNGVGDPESNWTYLVIAVDATEQEPARSNRVGEEDFEANMP